MTEESNDQGTPPPDGETQGGDAPSSTPPVELGKAATPPTPAPEATPKPLDAHSGDGDELAKAINRQNDILEGLAKSNKRIEEALYEDPDDTTPPTGSPTDAEASIVTPDPPPQPTPEEPDEVVPQGPARKKWKSRW